MKQPTVQSKLLHVLETTTCTHTLTDLTLVEIYTYLKLIFKATISPCPSYVPWKSCYQNWACKFVLLLRSDFPFFELCFSWSNVCNNVKISSKLYDSYVSTLIEAHCLHFGSAFCPLIGEQTFPSARDM